MPERLAQARIEFGAFLRHWRTEQGWVIRTFENWEKESPGQFRFGLKNATWNKIENGEGDSPNITSFIALGEMNAALAAQRYGTVHSRKLMDQLKRAQPIRNERGRVWEAGDFFDAFVGEAELPWEQVGRSLALASSGR